MVKRILVVAAHPDDELLGVGGTVARHVAEGDTVHAFIVGEGVRSRDGQEQASVSALRDAARDAARIIGFAGIQFHDFPDNQFDTRPLLELVKVVERAVAAFQPHVVYTHHAHDVNIDHCRTSEAVLTACRPCNPNCPEVVYAFETLSSTEWQQKDACQFAPSVYVNIEQTLEKKIAALGAYASEMRPYPHPRSPEGVRILAQYRGLECGLKYAEAFHVLRHIQR